MRARARWLPSEEWVNLRWLPWDEDRLYSLLRTDRARRVINRVGGAILVLLGVRSAASLA